MRIFDVPGGTELYHHLLTTLQKQLRENITVNVDVFIDITLQDLISIVAEETGVPEAQIKRSGSDGIIRMLAKKIVCWFAQQYIGASAEEVAQKLGLTTYSVRSNRHTLANFLEVQDELTLMYVNKVKKRLLYDP